MELFHKTAIEVCEGQQMDMDFETAPDVTISDYITMITNKTAVLLGASLETGALIAGATKSEAEHLYDFGKNIGIAFQLKDDILDVFGDDQKFGKMKGGDIVANKKTFLWIKAHEIADSSNSTELQKWVSDNSAVASQKVEAITRVYENLGIRELAESEMMKYFEESLRHLDAIDVSEDRKVILRQFAEKLMVREY